MNKFYSTYKAVFITMLIMAPLFIFAAILPVYLHGISSEKSILINTINNKKLDEIITNTCGSMPVTGLSVAITNKDETIYSSHYGQAVDTHSSFILGSTSKSFTALAILILLDEFKLEINDNANLYLPWIKAEITLLNLLNHTSGISTYEKMDNLTYSGEYGEFEYSNTNYNILGEIIEVVTGNTFSNYVDTHIFKMQNMFDSFALSEDTLSRTICGYKTYFGFPALSITQVPNKAAWIQAPSGYLCSSTSDMTKYLRFMLEYTYDDLTLLQCIKNTGITVSDNPAVEGIYGNTGLYGLGWIFKNVEGTEIVYHTGKTSSFTSIAVLLPEKDIGITVLCNMGDFLVGTNLVEHLYENVISVVIEKSDTVVIDKNAYWKQHNVINLLLLLLFFLSILPLILLTVSANPFQNSACKAFMFLIIHIAAPLLLISIFPIIHIPYDVVFDFAPDILFIIIVSSFNLFTTGILKLLFHGLT